jgi:glycosyltransferase involved in cell wall biosynthesis/2-polyprenyl-3-methyl-5-hydroxy-6-metoxy-1,4-benzoquinol methylase
MQSPWVNINKLQLTDSSVWSADSQKPFEYTDGEGAEQTLREILGKARDKSSMSVELDAAALDWVTAYHLGSKRANIYRYLDLSGLNCGLELGCGCGAITRYLAEQGVNLDAVEGNFQRAEIAALRCENIDNVAIIHADFNCARVPENTYDLVLLNGVLEYAKKFLPGTKNSTIAAQQVLAQAEKSLTADGVLCLAIENRMGLKYWLGAKEDHYNDVYRGVYSYPQNDDIRTWDRQQLDAVLSCLSGYTIRYFFPFPDYKMAQVVLSEQYVQENYHCHSHLYRIPSRDNGIPLSSHANEFLMWQGVRQAGKFGDFANSFFVLISKSDERLDAVAPYDFAHFSGTNRKPAYQVVTSKEQKKTLVQKKQMQPAAKHDSELIHHSLETGEFVQGALLATKWLEHCLVRDYSAFQEDIKEYYSFLITYFATTDQPEYAFDLVPFNIVIRDNEEFAFIDQEWGYHVDLTPEYILFRALLWFPGNNQVVLAPLFAEFKLATLDDFVKFGFSVVSLSLDTKLLDTFIALEEQFQRNVETQKRTDPVQRMLQEPLDSCTTFSAGVSIFLAQLYWQQSEEPFAEDRSVYVQGQLGKESQTLVFHLPIVNGVPARFRFDPAERQGFFHIFEIRVLAVDPDGSRSELWKISNGESIAEAATLENMYFCQGVLGDSFFAVTDDPSMVLKFPAQLEQKLEGQILLVEVDMDWPKSTDYLLVMDAFGHELAKQHLELKHLKMHIAQLEDHNQTQADRIFSNAVVLQEKEAQLAAKEVHLQDKEQHIFEQKSHIEEQEEYIASELKAKDQHIESLTTELAVLKGTRAWRLAEFFRKMVYYRVRSGIMLGKKSIYTLRHEGFRVFLQKSRRTLQENSQAITLGLIKSDYDKWVKLNTVTPEMEQEIRKRISQFQLQPLISILVPVYNVDQIWLEKTIESVQQQLYENWELCLVDDASPALHIADVLTRYAREDDRVKILLNKENGGIAETSNAALALATGEYVALLDHDDEISKDALYENVRIINQHPEVGLIYSDEDKLDMQEKRLEPFFKPDYSPDLLFSQNYICHFTIMKKSLVDEVGGFRKGYDGSQDHDIIMRVIEQSERVCHIPKILYHWRKIPGSTAAVYDSKSYAWEAGRLAIEDSMKRRGIPGTASFAKYQGSYRVTRDIIGQPLVTIIIPFKDKPEYLRRCLDSILEKTQYENFEVLGVSNNSSDQEVFSLMTSYAQKDSRIRFEEYNVPFNFPDICNYGVDKALGDYILFLNNDTEILSEEWLENLLEHAQRTDVGVVGGKLYYPDNRIQHAGIVVGLVGPAGHPHKFFHRDDVGYYARAHIIHNVSAVTGACLMVAKSKYLEVNGMDADHFPVAYNDIDFCLKLLEKGYLNVFTPYCEAYHYESVSRGYEDTPEKQERLQKETDYFLKKWQGFIEQGDPYYNPNLSLAKEDFSIRLPESR